MQRRLLTIVCAKCLICLIINSISNVNKILRNTTNGPASSLELREVAEYG